MKKLLFLLLMIPIAASAQSVEQQKKEINRVKKNFAQYIYVEIIDSTETVALDKARHYLLDEVEGFAKETKRLKDAGSVVALNVKEQTITMPRGNMFRAFVYVKKSDILASENTAVVTTEPAPAATRRQVTTDRLLLLTRFDELEECLTQMKQEGRIGHYAKYKHLSNPENYLLIIYNEEGAIEAVLSEGVDRVNLRTGSSDSVNNYKGRGAFGVIIND